VNATHSLGIYAGYIEFENANYSMTADGNTLSYAWTPTSTGVIDYTIYIHSNGNTWASVSGSLNVTAAATSTGTGTGLGGDMTMILIIAGAAAVVIVIIIIMKKKQ
jgi:hypothetical protein